MLKSLSSSEPLEAFRRTLKNGMYVRIVKLLVAGYRSQLFHVQWGNVLTDGFTVSNGVRQDGILSPFLFNLYTNSLSSALDDIGVGCHYLGSVNHVAYTDDMIIFAPTPLAYKLF